MTSVVGSKARAAAFRECRLRLLAMNLSDVLSRLYASEINCGMQSFWDAGWDVWIGDEANGKRAIGRSLTVDEIPEWLHSAALEHFPQSAYAREERATDLVGGQAP